jgi:hypothetical protein
MKIKHICSNIDDVKCTYQRPREVAWANTGEAGAPRRKKKEGEENDMCGIHVQLIKVHVPHCQ